LLSLDGKALYVTIVYYEIDTFKSFDMLVIRLFFSMNDYRYTFVPLDVGLG
jgi:hypothetical protein